MNPFADIARPIVNRPGDPIEPRHTRAPDAQRARPEPLAPLPAVANPWSLTPLEAEVMRLIVDGLTSQEIGERLHRSTKTIELYRQRILERMGMHSTIVAVVAWVRFTLLAQDLRDAGARAAAPSPTVAAAAIRTGERVTLAPIGAVDFGVDGLDVPASAKRRP